MYPMNDVLDEEQKFNQVDEAAQTNPGPKRSPYKPSGGSTRGTAFKKDGYRGRIRGGYRSTRGARPSYAGALMRD